MHRRSTLLHCLIGPLKSVRGVITSCKVGLLRQKITAAHTLRNSRALKRFKSAQCGRFSGKTHAQRTVCNAHTPMGNENSSSLQTAPTERVIVDRVKACFFACNPTNMRKCEKSLFHCSKHKWHLDAKCLVGVRAQFSCESLKKRLACYNCQLSCFEGNIFVCFECGAGLVNQVLIRKC